VQNISTRDFGTDEASLLHVSVRAQAHYRDYGKMTYARSVFVVHNIAHQGRGPMAELAPLEVPSAYTHFFRLDDPIGGVHMNVMKAGLMAAHRVVAVSHGCLPAFAAYNIP